MHQHMPPDHEHEDEDDDENDAHDDGSKTVKKDNHFHHRYEVPPTSTHVKEKHCAKVAHHGDQTYVFTIEKPLRMASFLSRQTRLFLPF